MPLVPLASSAAFCLFFWLGCLHHIEPFYTWFYVFAWSCWLPLAAWTARRRLGRPVGENRSSLVGIFLFSIFFWDLFEALNFRLNNWSYLHLPQEWFYRWPGYALSYASVVPAVLWASMTLAGPRWDWPAASGRTGGLLGIGLGMLAVTLLWPQWFFPLAWGAAFFLMEPVVQHLGGYSLVNEWRLGRFNRTGPLLAGGLVCGLLWEFCNYWAGSKWIYHLPYWNFGKIFEMPFLGFIGFSAFALEVHAGWELASRLWKRLERPEQIVISALAVGFCLSVFAGIDRWTVITAGRLSTDGQTARTAPVISGPGAEAD